MIYNFRDENPIGDWIITVKDLNSNGKLGKWNTISLTLYGESGKLLKEEPIPSPPSTTFTTTVAQGQATSSPSNHTVPILKPIDVFDDDNPFMILAGIFFIGLAVAGLISVFIIWTRTSQKAPEYEFELVRRDEDDDLEEAFGGTNSRRTSPSRRDVLFESKDDDA
jgi:hypothetical protein